MVITRHAEDDPNITVVRLKTVQWHDQKGIYVRRNITFLKRKSSGFNFLSEDASNDIDDCVCKIINLDQCCDGIYTVATINETRDWETGYVEDWDYLLVPHTDMRGNV